MSCHVQVNELPPAMRDEQEHIQGLEGRGLDREEVRCPDMGCVVLEEGAPGLGGRAMYHLPTVAADRASAAVVGRLSELTLNPYAPPARVLMGEALNEQSELRGEAWATRPAASALPGPVASPAGAVPADHGVRLDDDERRSPARPGTREPQPEQAIRPW